MPASRHDWMLAWVCLVTAGTSLTAELNAHFETELGISMPEQDLIKQIAMAGGAVKMTELAERIFLSKAGVTKMVDRLGSKGLLERVQSKTDRRVVNVVLTEPGQRVLEHSWKLLGPWVEENFRSHMSDDEVLALGGALGSLLKGRGIFEGMMNHLQGKPGPTRPV